MNNENIEKEFEELKNAYKDMFDNITIEQFKQVKEKVENERKLTATKMFEKLGYKKLVNRSNKIYLTYWKNEEEEDDTGCIYSIIFNKRTKQVAKTINNYFNYIDLQELQAINKQVEELGWYE